MTNLNSKERDQMSIRQISMARGPWGLARSPWDLEVPNAWLEISEAKLEAPEICHKASKA